MRAFSWVVGSIGLVFLSGLVACGSSDGGTEDSAGGAAGGSTTGGAAGSVAGGAGGGASGGTAGSSAGGAGGGLKPGDTLSVEDYCKGLVDAFCGTQYECCGKNDAKRQQCLQKHVPECVQSLNKQITAGTVKYHGEYAAACSEETKTQFACEMDMSGEKHTSPNCDAAVEGLVAAGGTCTADDQCVGDMSCSAKKGDTGECYTPVAEGQPCGLGCAHGLVCLNNLCSQPLGIGEKCTAVDQCGTKAYCNGIKLFPPGGEGVCAAKKKVGEPCDPQAMFGIDCEDFMCDPGTKTCSDKMRDICQYN